MVGGSLCLSRHGQRGLVGTRSYCVMLANAIDGHEKFLGEDYDTLVLVAAGSGVSYCLSNALDIVRRARAMHNDPKSRSIAVATKRLSFIWVIKKPGTFSPIQKVKLRR